MKRELTLSQLRHLTLESQGLTKPNPFGTGKNAVLTALEQLGYLQIDTLSIVERAHHHTLWTRIPDYQPVYLNELVQERKIFEYWFHAASYLPMKDFRFALPQMLDIKQSTTHYYNADPKVMQYVLDTIRTEGPKKSRDFEKETKKAGSWWSWKPTKIALERLFLQGDLMISNRNGMQKTYDITENVLPQNIDTSIPTDMEFAEYLVKTYLQAYGFTTIKQITHLKTGGLIRKNVEEILKSMLQEGTIQRINIENSPPIFIKNDLLEKSLDNATSSIQLLSPFDNSIIHRDRIKLFFDFDYKIECYTPKEKRIFGYFCLPILFGDTFIGRVDCKAHRKEKEFELIHLHVENTTINLELWLKPFLELVKSFATFNNCETLKLTQVTPSKLTNTILKFNNHG
ncbi:winged helix-turn-helix domain-containing protein [Chryseobacterium turcicum]|uniref:Winged helix DNA-binding domain-containing protein n=1 Tax=Chryseobacterium turcicum TaxID=2898076 RepID=A0A9Q3V5N4_9FLAO|nr:crosslink repair DNA glycosylase YcaQ family protein [Chryseobacterium turcicum]MCD1118606.1 winged helix DNA-binding domain-containing protein [Chryseobacterium turcicum]